MSPLQGWVMKKIIAVLTFIFSLSAFASLPLFQYSLHNKAGSSQLMVFEDGTILHQERAQYQNKTLNEVNLSSLEVQGLKNIINKILKTSSSTEVIETDVGSYSGTIELRMKNGLKIVEGVVHDSNDLYHSINYKSESASTEELKAFIFKYTQNDMNSAI